jgi:hypothetical protein
MMLSHRFFLSLVAGLFLSTLASANSITVNVTSMHAAGDGHANSYAGQSSSAGGTIAPAMITPAMITAGKTTPAMSIAYASRTSSFGSVISNANAANAPATGIVFPKRKYGPTCCDARPWVGSGQERHPPRPGLSTPEPSSLMLLSTGLMGIGGMVRRSFFRG